MNYYEAAYILDPNLGEEQLTAMKTDLRAKIETIGGKDIAEVRSERRTLTYPIRKHAEGHYVVFRYQAPPDSVGKLRLELKHNEQILRMSYLRIPDKVGAIPASAPTPTAAIGSAAGAAPVEPGPETGLESTPKAVPAAPGETASSGPVPV